MNRSRRTDNAPWISQEAKGGEEKCGQSAPASAASIPTNPARAPKAPFVRVPPSVWLPPTATDHDPSPLASLAIPSSCFDRLYNVVHGSSSENSCTNERSEDCVSINQIQFPSRKAIMQNPRPANGQAGQNQADRIVAPMVMFPSLLQQPAGISPDSHE